MFTALFTFDDMFRNMLLVGFSEFDCVVPSPTTMYTFTFKSNGVIIRGEGDHHDGAYSKYGKTLDTDSSMYSIRLYPTKTLYDFYI